MDDSRPRDSFLSEFGPSIGAYMLQHDDAFSPEYYSSSGPPPSTLAPAPGPDPYRPTSTGTTGGISWADSGYGRSPRTSASTNSSTLTVNASPRVSSLPVTHQRPSTAPGLQDSLKFPPTPTSRSGPQLSAPFWEEALPNKRAIRKSLERHRVPHQHSSSSVATLRVKRSSSGAKLRPSTAPTATPALSHSPHAGAGQQMNGNAATPSLKTRASQLLRSPASFRSFSTGTGSPLASPHLGSVTDKEATGVMLSALPPVIPFSNISSGDPITLDLFDDPCSASSKPRSSTDQAEEPNSLASPWTEASTRETGEMSKEQTDRVEMDEQERIEEKERKMAIFDAEQKLQGLGLGVGVVGNVQDDDGPKADEAEGETAEGVQVNGNGAAVGASSKSATPFVTPQTGPTENGSFASPLRQDVPTSGPARPAPPPPGGAPEAIQQRSTEKGPSRRPNVLRSLSSAIRPAPRPPKVPRIDPELGFHPTRPPTQRDLRNAMACKVVDPNGRSLTFGSLFPPPPPPSANRGSTSSAASIRSRFSSRSGNPSSHPYPTKGPLIVIFIRFFMCGYCQEYASQLSRIFARGTEARKALEEQNVRVAIVGTGSWKMLKAWKQVVGWEGMAFTDASPDKNLFRSLGMIRKTLSMGKTSEKGEYLAHLSLTQMMVNSTVNGLQMPLKNPGNLLQLGGEFCFDTVEALERSDPAALLRLKLAESEATDEREGAIKNHFGLQAFDYEGSKSASARSSAEVHPNGSMSPKSPAARASALFRRSHERLSLKSPRLTSVSETGVLSSSQLASNDRRSSTGPLADAASITGSAGRRRSSSTASVAEGETIESGIRCLYSNRMTTSRNHGPFTPLFSAAGVDVPRALPKPDVGKVKRQFKTVL